MDVHLCHPFVHGGKDLIMDFFEGRPGDQLVQIGRHEGQLDTAVDRPLGAHLIVIEAQFLLGIAHVAFKAPPQFVVAEDSFDR